MTRERSETEPLIIGVLGVGTIGRHVAERIAARWALVVCDIKEEATAPFASYAGIAQSVAELGSRVDIVIACLPSASACRDAILGPSGLTESKRARLFVNIGSAEPEMALEMAARLAECGIEMIGAPASGSARHAEAGELTIIASGGHMAFAVAEPVLKQFASTIFHLGEAIELAQGMKLINNMLSLSNLAFASEALVVGVKSGLDPHQMVDIINDGLGQSSATLVRLPKFMLPRNFNYGRSIEFVLMDLRNFMKESARHDVPSALAAAIAETYERAAAEGSIQDDITTLICHMEKEAGIQVSSAA